MDTIKKNDTSLRGRLSEALQNCAIENLSEDMRFLVDSLDELPEKIDANISKSIDHVLEVAEALNDATTESKQEYLDYLKSEQKKSIDDFEDHKNDLLIKFTSTIERSCLEQTKKLNVNLDKLNDNLNQKLNTKETKKKGKIKFYLISIALSFVVGIASMYYVDQSTIANKQEAIDKLIKATGLATSTLDANSQKKFNTILKKNFK